MRLVVQLLAPGFALEQPFQGRRIVAHAARFRDLQDREVHGLVASVNVDVNTTSVDFGAELATIVALGAFDLVHRWPSASSQVRVVRGGVRIDQPSIPIHHLAPYELGQMLGGGAPLPNSVLSTNEAALHRVDDLLDPCLSRSQSLPALRGALAQISIAAASARPQDRLIPLWSAISMLHPSQGGDLDRIRTITSADGFAREERDSDPAWRLMSRHRKAVAADSWFHSSIRAALSRPARTIVARMQAGTTFAYAARSAIAHGHWSGMPGPRRPLILASERWLWVIVEREIEQTLFRSRLPRLAGLRSTTTA